MEKTAKRALPNDLLRHGHLLPLDQRLREPEFGLLVSSRAAFENIAAALMERPKGVQEAGLAGFSKRRRAASVAARAGPIRASEASCRK